MGDDSNDSTIGDRPQESPKGRRAGHLLLKPVSPPEKSPHPIAEAIEKYINSLRNIGQAVQLVMPHLSKWLDEEFKKQEAILSKYLPPNPRPDVPEKIALKGAREYVEFSSAVKALDALHENRTLAVLARSLFMQMFCEFDAFTGTALKAIYSKNESLLKGLKKEITFQDLIEYKSIEAIKSAILEKEIENFRRDSYAEQFTQLEGKFSLQLKKFEDWGPFVELSQRRNLFVHNDGLVSDQYLTVCDREGYKFETRPAIGEPLAVDIKYFSKALRILSKVGFMLGHTLWSKVFPKEHVDLHRSINHILYSCLEQKRWMTAKELGVFALTEPMRKHVAEVDLRIRAVNVAIGLKFSGDEPGSKQLLETFDWSASYRDFKLALLVLSDEFSEACKLMRVIGKSGEIIDQSAYHTWPLFHKFRELPEFYETYTAIYGEPYSEKLRQDGEVRDVSVGASGNIRGEETLRLLENSTPAAPARPKSTAREKSKPEAKASRKKQTPN